jgi:hypothetical protein
LEQQAAQVTLDGLIVAAQQLSAAQQALQVARAAGEGAAQNLQKAEDDAVAAQVDSATAAKALIAATEAREAAQQDALRRNAAEKAEQAGARLAQVEQKCSALEQARAALALHRVTAKALALIERAQAEMDRLQTEAASGGVQMQIAYEGDARITANGAPLDPGGHRIGQRQVFELEGIGRMTLDPGAATADMAAVEEARARLRAALGAVDMPDLATARTDAVRRGEEEAQIALLESVIETLAPDGTSRFRQDAAQAQAALAQLNDAARPECVDPADLARDVEAAQKTDEAARQHYDSARDARDAARAEQARAQADLRAAQATLESASAAYGEVATFEARKAKAARDLATAQVAAQDAVAAAETLRGAAPDLANATAALNRAKSATETAREERGRLRTRAAELTATIRTRAEDGVEEKRDEMAERMQAATERAARFAHEAAGLRMLLDALRAKRGAAQEAYFGPVQQELAPLLALLHEGAALSFDPASLLPAGLARGDAEEQMEMLSGGTQEQIAILTRLAFARLFARQGKPMPIILDDALVYSDDTRITAMFTALHRVAADQQVIVFTCRQMAFAGLGGVRPQVEVVQER